MHKNISRIAVLIACLVSIAGVANADTKVKSRQTSGGQTYENTSYIKGKRQRSETNNGQMVMVQQCDLRRNIQIMPEAKAYIIQPYDDPATSNAGTASGSPSQPGAVRKGGVVTSTVTTKDTGERKQMFGYTARHIITTMVMDSTPDACSPVKNKMEIDGWYIDAAFAFECDSQRTYTPYRPQANGGCHDRYETKQIGIAKKGFPVWEKTTMFGPNGAESFSNINEVIEFSSATLDPSLFDIPAGYREVKDFASALSANYGATGSAMPSTPETAPSSNVNTAANQPNNAASTALGPKRPGVLRIGVVAVKTGAVGEALNARDLALAVQNTLTTSLQAKNVEVVAIQATGAAIQTEAQQKECDFVVFNDVSHKKGGGGFGSFLGSSASSVASSVGYGGGTAAGVAANTATHVIIAATVAQNIKAKDELTLDMRMERASGTPVFGKQFKAKAKSAGEDIVTPAVEQAAQAIVDVAKK
ncbi:MAG TPA: hypothetical protein VFR12_04140 [Pyrinomonadaceae bacterium]|nr:hypothetical protein [Pyrinomonadaceae bacterium]